MKRTLGSIALALLAAGLLGSPGAASASSDATCAAGALSARCSATATGALSVHADASAGPGLFVLDGDAG